MHLVLVFFLIFPFPTDRPGPYYFFIIHYTSLCSLLALSPEDVLPAVYLCTNRIAPEHENTVILYSILFSLHSF